MKGGAAGEACGVSQVLFDAEQLVVFRGSIGARQRSGLDLAGICRDGKIGDEWIFGFTGAMRDDRRATISLGQFNTVQGFR